MSVYDLNKEKERRRRAAKNILGGLVLCRRKLPRSSPVIIILFLLFVVVALSFLQGEEMRAPTVAVKAYSSQEEELTGRAVVVDGDTLKMNGKRFRLYGIDAPERGQTCKKEGHSYPCGQEASQALERLIGEQSVVCEQMDVDRYRRIVAICRTSEHEINQWMVVHGYALAYEQYSSRYVGDETKAKEARAGVWAGSFEAPWEYRRRK